MFKGFALEAASAFQVLQTPERKGLLSLTIRSKLQ